MTRGGVFALGLFASVAATGVLGYCIVYGERVAATARAPGTPQTRAGVIDEPAPAPAAPLALGPARGSRAEREQAVLALLQGQVEARGLPVAATENGAAYDPELRNRLTPLRYKQAPDRRPVKCPCPPGDPLCSCL